MISWVACAYQCRGRTLVTLKVLRILPKGEKCCSGNICKILTVWDDTPTVYSLVWGDQTARIAWNSIKLRVARKPRSWVVIVSDPRGWDCATVCSQAPSIFNFHLCSQYGHTKFATTGAHNVIAITSPRKIEPLYRRVLIQVTGGAQSTS